MNKYAEGNLIVGFEYYGNRARVVQKSCKDYEVLLNTYLTYLKRIEEEGLKSGNTAEVFHEYVEIVMDLKGIIEDLGKDYSKRIETFLKDIEDADDRLYTKKKRRNFTDYEFAHALASVWPEFSFENFGGWLFDSTIGRLWTSKLIDDSRDMVKKVDQLKKVTRAELTEIQRNVKRVDRIYHGYLKNIYKILEKYNRAIQELSQVMNPSINCMDKKNIVNLRNFITEMTAFQREYVKNPDVNIIEDNDIKWFADNVHDYFLDSTKSIKSICEASFANFFIDDFDKYRATVNAAKEYFNSFSKGYIKSKKDFEAAKKTFDEMLKLYKKYGSKWTEEYRGNPDNIELFNKIIGAVGDFSENADLFLDSWYQMFFDMSESKKALLGFKKHSDLNNPSVNKAYRRIEELYDKELDAYLSEVTEELWRLIKSEGKKAAANVFVEFLKKQEFRIIGEIASKVVDQAYKEMPAVAMYDWIEETGNTFENVMEKLRMVDSNSPELKILLDEARIAFDAAKKARLDFYKLMISSASDRQKGFYQTCYDEIKAASFADETYLNITGENEYYGNVDPFDIIETAKVQ